eukprot:g5968.t1
MTNRAPAVEAYTTQESRTYNYSAVGPRVEVFSTVAYPQYSCYKIPYLFQTLNGTIIAFAEARGPTDDEGSIGNCMDWDITDVVMRKSYDGGASWSPMQVLLRGKHDWHFVVGNLAPVQSEFSGRLFLPFTRGNSRMWMTYSDDNGESFAPPYRLSFEGFWWTWVGFGPPAGLQLSYNAKYRGRLVIPGYFSDSPVFDLTALFGSSAFVLLSDDEGLTWRVVVVSNAHQELIGIAGNEDQVVEHCDGTLLLNSRTWIGGRAQSWSHDGGDTWSPLERVALPNPFQGCQGSVMNLNRHVLLYSGLKGAGKSDWDAVIHEGGASYSALYRLLDGRVAVIYEIGNLSPIFIPLNIYVKILPRFDLAGVDDANTGTTATALPGVVPRDDSMSCDRNATTLFALEPRRFFYADASDSRVEVSTPPSPSEVEWPAQWSLPLRAYPMTWQETAQKSRFSSHSTFMWSFHWWVTIFATVGLLILSGMVAFLSSTCCLLPVCRSRRKVLVQENLLVSGPQLGWMLVEKSGCAKALCRGRELLMERKTPGECACSQPEDEAVSFSNSGGIFMSLNAERDDDEGKAEHVEQRGVQAPLPARVAAFFRQRENQTRYCLPLLQLWNTVWLLFWMLGGLLALFFAHDDPVRWVFQTNLSLFGMALSVLLGLGKMHFFAELPSFKKQLAERPSVEVAVFMLTVILVTSICSTTL